MILERPKRTLFSVSCILPWTVIDARLDGSIPLNRTPVLRRFAALIWGKVPPA
jgi:hypothetical protein